MNNRNNVSNLKDVKIQTTHKDFDNVITIEKKIEVILQEITNAKAKLRKLEAEATLIELEKQYVLFVDKLNEIDRLLDKLEKMPAVKN